MERPNIATTPSVGTDFVAERTITDRIRDDALSRARDSSNLVEQIGCMAILGTAIASLLLFTVPERLAGLPDVIRENPISFTVIAGSASSAVAFVGNQLHDGEIERIRSEASKKIGDRYGQYPDVNAAGVHRPSLNELTRGL
jgi:hypothetical protein